LLQVALCEKLALPVVDEGGWLAKKIQRLAVAGTIDYTAHPRLAPRPAVPMDGPVPELQLVRSLDVAIPALSQVSFLLLRLQATLDF
jgi:hypothetical protein